MDAVRNWRQANANALSALYASVVWDIPLEEEDRHNLIKTARRMLEALPPELRTPS